MAELGQEIAGLRKLFSNISDQYANLPALTVINDDGTKTIATYRRLRNDIASGMRILNDRVGDAGVVSVKAENRYESVVCLLAVIFSGRSLCLLNASDPIEQIERRMGLLPTSCVVSPRDFVLPNRDVSVDDSFSTVVDPKADDTTLVYVFTSGSTGHLKVVPITEQMLLANVRGLIAHHRLEPGRSVATALPVFHVNALGFSLLSSLLSGAELILFERFNPARLIDFLATRSIDIYSLVPPALRVLTQFGRKESSALKKIGYILSAATALSTSDVRDFSDLTGVRVIQGYGLSEGVNFSCTMPIDLDPQTYSKLTLESRFPSIGTALPCNDVVVLRPDSTECEAEEVGELAIRGENVMAGYLHDSGFRARDEHFRTGDLGYFENVGSRKFFFITGRSKDCLKRAGETVALREIDDVIAEIGIRGLDAIAVGFKNEFVGEEIALVCRHEAPLRESDSSAWKVRLHEALKIRLSPNLRPKVILTTNEELRNPSGKPMRWKFTEKFAIFHGQSFLSKTVWL